MLDSINPVTETPIASYPLMSAGEWSLALDRATALVGNHSQGNLEARLTALAAALRAHKEEHARLITLEMGKPIVEARIEIEKCAIGCEYYAGICSHAAVLHDATHVAREGNRHAYVVHRPLGAILGIMPWNFPFWQAIRFAVPAIVAGNTGLLKHAPNVTGAALALESLFLEAGFEAGVFQTLRLSLEQTAEVIADSRIAGVSLTGSTRAGKAVAALAGQYLKPAVLELGGSDPYLILADADIAQAVAASMEGRFRNAGQSCIAAKRFITVPEIHNAFVAAFHAEIATLTWGNPLDEQCKLGSLARPDLRGNLHRQVLESVAQGATIAIGGYIPPEKGSFYPPTLLLDVQAGMPAYSEELFGPVAAVIAAKDSEDAIRIANDTSFGLGAAVFTRDTAKGEQIATHRLHAGTCVVNGFVRSDPRLPFGGVQESGYGRELGFMGVHAFTNAKTIWVY